MSETRLKFEMEVELESGDYSVKVHNLSNPGEHVDFELAKNVLHTVVKNWEKQVIREESPSE